MFIEILLFTAIAIGIFFFVSGLFFPEAFSPKEIALWKLYYEDPNFFMIGEHEYDNGVIRHAWVFRFPDKPQCDVIVYSKGDGRLHSMIIESGFGEIYVDASYRILNRMMLKKVMPHM